MFQRLSIFITILAFVGFFALAIPDVAISGIGLPGAGPGCCIGEGGCVEFGEGAVACIANTVNESGFCSPEPGLDGMCVDAVSNIPTLNEWGLIALAGILGLIGYTVLRKRRATA